MSCEECKEQVFELIEREAVDPEGVRAILADCPDCRAEFDAMKAALMLAGQMPLEEPPADIDAKILRKAELHIDSAAPDPAPGVGEKAQVIPFHKKMFQVPPWAMAAVALLAVGVGVWSIPRTVQFESDADQPMLEANDDVQMAEAPREAQLAGAAASEEAAVVAMDELREAAPVAPRESAKSTGERARRRAPRPNKRRDVMAKQAAPESETENLAMTPAAAPAVEKGEGLAKRSVAGGEAGAGADVASSVLEDSDAKRQETSDCRARVTAFELRLRDDERYEPEPEEELAIGRCYQTLGDTANARKWLRRAAAKPTTKRRARKALQALPSK